MDIKVLGIDLDKTVCSLAGLDEVGAVARKLVISANALCKRRREWEPSHF